MIEIVERTSNILIIQQKPNLKTSLMPMVIVFSIFVIFLYIFAGILQAIGCLFASLMIVGFWFQMMKSSGSTWKVEKNQKLLTVKFSCVAEAKTYSIDQAQLVRTVFGSEPDSDDSFYFIEFQLAPPNQPVRISIGAGILSQKEQQFLIESFSSFLGIRKGEFSRF